MKIIIFDDIESGCWWVRNKLTMPYLKKMGHQIVATAGNKFVFYPDEWDICVFGRVFDEDFSPIFNAVKNGGGKIIYDIDDAFDLISPINTAFNPVKNQLKSYFFLLRNADLITTTTPELKKHLSKLTNKEIIVIPNSVEPTLWEMKEKSDKLKVVFAGSNTHINDIQIVIDVIADLQNEIDFNFTLFGFSRTHKTAQEWIDANKNQMLHRFPNHPFTHSLLKFEKGINKIKNFTWEMGVPIEQYAEKLCSLGGHIGIAPLEDIGFNHCKSAIKFYEYAMAGMLTLASNVYPYSRETPLLVKNKYSAWKSNLGSLLQNKTGRNELLTQQREWVIENRTTEKIAKLKEQIYLDLIKR
jgi:hypothetical protein